MSWDESIGGLENRIAGRMLFEQENQDYSKHWWDLTDEQRDSFVEKAKEWEG